MTTTTIPARHPTPQARRQAAAAELHDARCGLIAAARHADGLDPKVHLSIMAAIVAVDDARQALAVSR